MNVRPLDADTACAQLAAWAYPRPIGALERDHSTWITDVPRTGIFWLVPGPLDREHRCVHVCVAPEYRLRRAFDPDLYKLIRWTAGLLGARRVYAPLGTMYPGWARFLMRQGFDQKDHFGPYFDLPEGD